MPSALQAPPCPYIGQPDWKVFPEGVTATAANGFTYGQFVKISSGVVVAYLDPTSNGTANGVATLGIALRDSGALSSAETVNTAKLPVAIANDNLQIVLPIYSSTASNTYPSNNAIGSYYRIGMQGGIMTADYANKQSTVTGGVEIVLTGYFAPYNVSEPYPWGVFRVINTQRQLN